MKAHPNDVVYKRSLMIGYGHVGDALGSPITNNLGDSTGARAYYRKAVAIGEEIYNSDPRDSTAKFDLAAGLERLGMVDWPASDAAESLTVLRRSATILESLVSEDPKALSLKKMLALSLEYEGHRLQTLGRYRDAAANYRRSVALSDAVLMSDPTDRPALSQAVASGRAMATAMAMAGNRAGALRQAQATIARAEAGVQAGPDQRTRQRYVVDSTIELGSVYEILAKQSRPLQSQKDWQAAHSTLQRAVSMVDAAAAGKKLASLDANELQKAKNLLAEADRNLSSSQPSGP